jgi:putative salt-induced outer membrane protein YdiY
MQTFLRLPVVSDIFFGVSVALWAAVANAGAYVPPDDGKDWLQLTSGEWLGGELIGMFYDQVEFDSDVLDDLTIDIEDVSGFTSPRRFGVRIRGYELLVGNVSIDDETVVIAIGEDERRFPRAELVALTVTADRERDRWSGDLSLGFNVRQGNTDVIEYNMFAGAERRTARSRAFVDYLGSFNETEGEQVANNHRVNGVVDVFSGSRLFWRPFIGQFFRDPFQNIRHQITLETGLGYDVIDTSRTEWEVFAGVGVNSVRRESVAAGRSKDSQSPAFSVGTNYEIELTSWIDYLFSFTATALDEESGTYQHHLVTTLSTDLIGDIDFDVSFVWDRTEDPPPLADGTVPERDDVRLLVGVGYEF